MNVPRTAAVAVAAIIGIGLTVGNATPTAAAAARPGHSGGTGTIRVKVIHNYGADHAKGRKICALATGKKDKVLGKCDTANAAGIAVLKRVPAGVCTVGAFVEFGAPYTRSNHNVHVHAGSTTTYTWHFNEVEVS